MALTGEAISFESPEFPQGNALKTGVRLWDQICIKNWSKEERWL